MESPHTTLGREHRQYLYGLLGFPPYHKPVVNRIVLVSQPAVDDPETYQPTEYLFMAIGRKNQFSPLPAQFLKDDGTPGAIDGSPSFSFEPPDLAELYTNARGEHFAKLLDGGAVLVTISADVDLGEGVKTLEASGQIVITDPEDDQVTRIELNIQDAIDDPEA